MPAAQHQNCHFGFRIRVVKVSAPPWNCRLSSIPQSAIRFPHSRGDSLGEGHEGRFQVDLLFAEPREGVPVV
mgnify:CR=1 FL=1